MDQQLALGWAIAEQRRRRGLSQAELARLLHQPPSWVSQVERGLIQVDAMSLLEAVASALGTPLPAHPAGPRGGPVASTASAQALRYVASGECQRRARPASWPAPAARLRAKADEAWALASARHYGELAELLNDLLPDLQSALGAAHDHRERAVLHEVMAASYQACAAALAKIGEHESAKGAASRALTAAQRAGDLLLAAASAYLLARILLEAGRYAQAEETARKATAVLTRPAGDGRAEAISLLGALALLRALTAARNGDPPAAEEQLSVAREMARKLGDASNARGAGLSPDHIALYEAAVSIQAGLRIPAGQASQAAPGATPLTRAAV
jgi:transcriptional regulator with XRE-family HTH domain